MSLCLFLFLSKIEIKTIFLFSDLGGETLMIVVVAVLIIAAILLCCWIARQFLFQGTTNQQNERELNNVWVDTEDVVEENEESTVN